MKTAALLLIVGVAAPSLRAEKAVKVETEWKAGSVAKADNDLWKKAPKDGVIADPAEWAALWKAWFKDAEAPKIDFDKELILAVAGQGPNVVDVEDLILSEKGDLRFNWSVTERAGDGFVGRILRIRKDGIRTVNGKELPRPRAAQDAPPSGAQVFVYPEKVTAGDVLSFGGKGERIAIKGETTLVWMDLVPGARFAHPTECVLISAEGTRVIKGDWWLVLNGKPLFRDGKEYKADFPVNLPK